MDVADAQLEDVVARQQKISVVQVGHLEDDLMNDQTDIQVNGQIG